MAFHHRPKHIEEDENWLITYADMITLMMAFFVIMISVSKPDAQKAQQISESLKAAGFEENTEKAENPEQTLSDELQIMIENQSLEETMSVEKTDKGVTLELSSGAFYEGGSAKFKKEALPILKEVATVLKDFDFNAYEVQVDGHTDDIPIKSPLYPSNWELSASRASNIVRFFIAYGIKEEIMRASGYAHVKPKMPNLDPDGNPVPENRELNRRVVIRVERVE